MHGTWVMPHQNGRGNKTGQGNIGKQRIPMNGPNPAAESGLSTVLPESELRTGAETSLELAGQNPEAAAQQAEQTLKGELKSFRGAELKMLVGVTIKVIQENNLGPNANPTPIAREVLSIATPFTQKADELLMSTLKRIQEVLNSPDTSVDNNPSNNFPGFGSTPTSSGSALAA